MGTSELTNYLVVLYFDFKKIGGWLPILPVVPIFLWMDIDPVPITFFVCLCVEIYWEKMNGKDGFVRYLFSTMELLNLDRSLSRLQNALKVVLNVLALYSCLRFLWFSEPKAAGLCQVHSMGLGRLLRAVHQSFTVQGNASFDSISSQFRHTACAGPSVSPYQWFQRCQRRRFWCVQGIASWS